MIRILLSSALLLGLGTSLFAQVAARTEQYADFNPGVEDPDKGTGWGQAIRILSPELRSAVRGDVLVEFVAPGMTVARVMCWKQPTEERPDPLGHDAVVADVELDAQGRGSFVFPADDFPHGPVHVRIGANNEDRTKRDYRELQLFNLGGVKWNHGIPERDPPQAQGMDLVFADDFDGPLSISKDGLNARYHSHKPGGGDFSGWPFSDYESELNPFSQTGTWLRIRGSKRADGKSSSGLITPAKADFTGEFFAVPFYTECRFVAQSAPGTWPAFWTLTHTGDGTNQGDELDIIEAYGGFGKGNPNYTGYSTTSHFWRQKDEQGNRKKGKSSRHDMLQLGAGSSWSWTFHTYGLKVTEEDTIYYFNDIEVFRHPTNELSKRAHHYFLINYAIGGISGWPIDMKREGNATDMYVDYVRVYSAKPAVVLKPEAGARAGAIGLTFVAPGHTESVMPAELVAGEPGVSQNNWNNLTGHQGAEVALMDQSGVTVPGVSVTWSVAEGDVRAGREWGFTTGNLRMVRGLATRGALSVSGIPYKKYDVHAYFNAGTHGGAGKVALSTPDAGVDSMVTYFYSVGWHGGKFVRSSATSLNEVKDANYVVFSGNTAESFSLGWVSGLKGHWTGLSGLQIVETP